MLRSHTSVPTILRVIGNMSIYRSEVIYYGPPGLDADVFEKAMLNLGFWVDHASAPGDLLSDVDKHPRAITVIAAKWEQHELLQLVRAIRIHQGDGGAPIFVVGAGERVEPRYGEVRFVPPAQRLRGTVHGIGDYVRNRGRGEQDLHTSA